MAPFSLALTAIALSIPALADQAGEARNDIVGIFFLLAAVAVALAQRERGSNREASETAFALGPVVGCGSRGGDGGWDKAQLPPAGGGPRRRYRVVAPQGRRWRALVAGGLAALAGGGYWYLRNLAHTGNPLPWVKHLGPITLPAPEQALGGREGHSVSAT